MHLVHLQCAALALNLHWRDSGEKALDDADVYIHKRQKKIGPNTWNNFWCTKCTSRHISIGCRGLKRVAN